MGKKTVTKDDMHFVERIDFDGVEDPEFQEFAAQTQPTVAEQAKNDCEAISEWLMAEGWPDPSKNVVYEGEVFWCYLESPGDYVPGSTISPGFSYISKMTGPLEDVHLSAELYLAAFSFLLKCRAKDFEGAIDSCARYLNAKNILLNREKYLKPVTDRKEKVRKGSEGGSMTSDLTKTERDQVMYAMNGYIQNGESLSSAASKVARALGKGNSVTARNTIVRRWNRNSQKYGFEKP